MEEKFNFGLNHFSKLKKKKETIQIFEIFIDLMRT